MGGCAHTKWNVQKNLLACSSKPPPPIPSWGTQRSDSAPVRTLLMFPSLRGVGTPLLLLDGELINKCNIYFNAARR